MTCLEGESSKKKSVKNKDAVIWSEDSFDSIRNKDGG
jgi:hypothetical protein